MVTLRVTQTRFSQQSLYVLRWENARACQGDAHAHTLSAHARDSRMVTLRVTQTRFSQPSLYGSRGENARAHVRETRMAIP